MFSCKDALKCRARKPQNAPGTEWGISRVSEEYSTRAFKTPVALNAFLNPYSLGCVERAVRVDTALNRPVKTTTELLNSSALDATLFSLPKRFAKLALIYFACSRFR